MLLKAIDIAESIMQRRSEKKNLKVLRTDWTRQGLAFFGTPHQAPSHRSPGVIETVFSLVSTRTVIRSPYNPELCDQVENLAGNRETQVRLSSNHEDLCRFYIASDNYRKVTRNLLQLCSA